MAKNFPKQFYEELKNRIFQKKNQKNWKNEKFSSIVNTVLKKK